VCGSGVRTRLSTAVTKILVVDDDPSLLKALRIGLVARGDDVLTAHTGVEALNQVALGLPDLVILDLGLPDLDGIEVCRRVREFSHVPIVVLSAYGDERRKVEALDSGADDFVTKPFGMAELEARLRVALRHSAAGGVDGTEAAVLHVGDLNIDLVHHMATLNGQSLHLTAREFDLLAYLARHAGKVCTHHMILKDVWGPGYGAESNYVRVYAHRLRKKLGDDEGHLLRTVPGIGYQLAVNATSSAPMDHEDDSRARNA
jgi:two-component system, OmpR family, KDP operon response regulator KdpE